LNMQKRKKNLSKQIILIPSDLPWNWTADYYNQTINILARNNIVIVALMSEMTSLKEIILQRKCPVIFQKKSHNIFFYKPIYIIPLRRFHIVEKTNKLFNLIMLWIIFILFFLKYKHDRSWVWIFSSELVNIAKLFKGTGRIIFDCVDYHYQDTGITKRNKKICKSQLSNLLTISHYVFVNSKTLYSLYHPIRKDIVLVPQGCFIPNTHKHNEHHVLNIIKPIIGYQGGINNRLDYSLLYSIARSHQELLFVLWGPVQDEKLFHKNKLILFNKLKQLHNIIIGQSNTKDEIYSVVGQFNVAIIPYDINYEFNKYCYPMKLFEYFYMGKPVISTPIKELKRFTRFVKIGLTPEEWKKYIRQLLSKPWPNKYKIEQKKLAVENSWEHKINTITSFITSDSDFKL
ncbi:MAG: hypothetical protein A2V66_11455, partial [Ignavibacteria bacterium RBG_13_36_8]